MLPCLKLFVDEYVPATITAAISSDLHSSFRFKDSSSGIEISCCLCAVVEVLIERPGGPTGIGWDISVGAGESD